MPERLTVVNASSLLPTPVARDWKEGQQPHYRNGVKQVDNLPRAIFQSGEITRFPDDNMLRTPSAIEGQGGSQSAEQKRENRNMIMLRDQVSDLAYAKGYKVPGVVEKFLQEREVEQIPEVSFGKFEPAIRQWETITGRTPPQPTIPDGRDNAHRLSPRFTEWMMGLPDGWVTDVGLSRTAELKLCGNGVVPQQATLAINSMVSEIIEEIKNG